jgi:hypothetical protein
MLNKAILIMMIVVMIQSIQILESKPSRKAIERRRIDADYPYSPFVTAILWVHSSKRECWRDLLPPSVGFYRESTILGQMAKCWQKEKRPRARRTQTKRHLKEVAAITVVQQCKQAIFQLAFKFIWQLKMRTNCLYEHILFTFSSDEGSWQGMWSSIPSSSLALITWPLFYHSLCTNT